MRFLGTKYAKNASADGPRWGSLECSPRPLARFKGPTSKGRGQGRSGGEEGTRERDGWKGKGGGKGEEAYRYFKLWSPDKTNCYKHLSHDVTVTLSTLLTLLISLCQPAVFFKHIISIFCLSSLHSQK